MLVLCSRIGRCEEGLGTVYLLHSNSRTLKALQPQALQPQGGLIITVISCTCACSCTADSDLNIAPIKTYIPAAEVVRQVVNNITNITNITSNTTNK